MNNKQLIDHFTKFGFVKLSKVLDLSFLKEINQQILNCLSNFKLKKNLSIKDQAILFENIILKKIKNINNKSSVLFDIQSSIFNHLETTGVLKNILEQNKIHSFLTSILGSDLEYKIPNEFIINIKSNEKNNYLFKKYHQEIWSGASTNTLLIWVPLFHNAIDGQMKLIKGSHFWGHVPHHNKSPIKMPKKAIIEHSNCELGDIIVFHTLVLHSSAPLKSKKNRVVGRLSMGVRNFKYPSNGFENSSDWKKYSYSSLSVIEKVLGNPQLSPFRLDQDNIKKNSWRNYFSEK
jgi:ectoine hydroxylase-related dioxygenase (phytanoyl-CoA dioxygenase family)